MATTLANLRAALNEELGITDDAETSPWSTTARNRAISNGYAALWRVGVRKPVTQTIATVDDTWRYALTSIREADRVELLDSSSNILEQVRFTVEDDGSGGYALALVSPISSSYSMRVWGYAPYTSTFASDAALDDLPAEYNRVPLLKAKAILYRQQFSSFMRYRERQSVPPELNITLDQLLAAIAAAEREFEVEAKRIANQRPRVMKSSRVLWTST